MIATLLVAAVALFVRSASVRHLNHGRPQWSEPPLSEGAACRISTAVRRFALMLLGRGFNAGASR